jgi:hypothetical protein
MFKDMNVLMGPSRHAVELEKLWVQWDDITVFGWYTALQLYSISLSHHSSSSLQPPAR